MKVDQEPIEQDFACVGMMANHPIELWFAKRIL